MSQLLPIGLHDTIGAEAYWLNTLKQKCLYQIYHYGYDIVEPTPLEYDDNSNENLKSSRFLVYDPHNDRPLILRSDSTPQIARIARQHYIANQLPIRLGYVGQVFQMRASQMKPERQCTQVGAEFYGNTNDGFLEIIRLLSRLLRVLNVGDIVIDLNNTNITERVFDLANLNPLQRTAVSMKQMPDDLSDSATQLIEPLLSCTGHKSADIVWRYPDDINNDIVHLLALQKKIQQSCSGISVTIDWADGRYLSYHNGLCFHVFALNQDIGRGGMYRNDGLDGVGFSFYLDPIVRHSVLTGKLPPIVTVSDNITDTEIDNLIMNGNRIVFKD